MCRVPINECKLRHHGLLDISKSLQKIQWDNFWTFWATFLLQKRKIFLEQLWSSFLLLSAAAPLSNRTEKMWPINACSLFIHSSLQRWFCAIAFLQQCALRIQDFAILSLNTLELKIRTGPDPHSLRTQYGKSHVCAMQFSVWGKFPGSCKTL